MADELDSISPVEFMDYENVLVEFLGEERAEAAVEEERSSSGNRNRNSPSAPPHPGPDPTNIGNKSLELLLLQARQCFKQYWKTGELPINDSVLDVANLGRALLFLDDVNIVGPDGESIQQDLTEVFRNRMWEEENYWDVAFELEMAGLLKYSGFDISLIEEGSAGGPDILIHSSADDVWVECKRKRDLAPEAEQWTRLKKTLLAKCWNHLDIGPDGFVLRISGDSELREHHLDPMSKQIVELIESRNDSAIVEIEGVEFEVQLIDYHEGERIVDLKDRKEMELFDEDSGNEQLDLMRKSASPSVLGEILSTDVFSHLDREATRDAEGYADAAVMFSREGNVRIRNPHMVNFNIPNELDYYRGIRSSMESASKNLSGLSPSIAFIHVPESRLSLMRKEPTEYNGESMSWHKRLEIGIKGILNNNSDLNAVIITSRLDDHQDNGVVSVRFGEPHFHIAPEKELPNEVREFLADDFTAEIDWGSEF